MPSFRTHVRFASEPAVHLRRALLAAAVLSCGEAARAQIAFSMDWQGPSVSLQDPVTLQPLTEGDVLRPTINAPNFDLVTPPRVALPGSALSLAKYSICLGHAAGTPCGVEIDALARGEDALMTLSGTPAPTLPFARRIWFSVDEYAQGAGLPVPGHASVLSESPVGDASADVFVDTGLPAGPLPPNAVAPHSAGTIDGNGSTSASGFAYFGVGLREPNPPSATLPNPGDNLDALDIGFGPGFPASGVYYSVDGPFPDPLTGLPSSNTASSQGVRAADVVRVATAGGTPVVYASANQLGLDLLGNNTDDLDALVVGENGDGVFQVSHMPYDWLSPSAPRDMLMFSVRRGSAVIGRPDSIFGLPIEPGDILVPPIAGGVSSFPGIFIAAENLGLATRRDNPLLTSGDDVDALAFTDTPCFDCNSNGVEDSVDIATGSSADANMNGIPDECEQAFSTSCNCPTGSSPCGNDDPSAGCANSTGVGGVLSVLGSTSVFADDMILTADQLPANVFGLMFMGDAATVLPFGDGLRCLAGHIYRFPAKSSGAAGSISFGRGIAGYTCANLPALACIQAGDTRIFQCWYRDPSGPCGSGSNLSSGLTVTFTP